MNYQIINGIICIPNFSKNRFDVIKKDFFVIENKIKFTHNEKIDKKIDAKGGVILPGLVNAHNHIYSTLSKGLPVREKFINFEGILKNLWWKLDSILDEKDTVLSTLISIKESFENGVTTVFDHHISMKFIENSLSKMADLFEKYHLNGTLSFETTNRYGIENRDKIINENVKFYNMQRDIKGLFGMHALLTLEKEDLKKISSSIPPEMPIHIHVAEGENDEILSKMKYGMPIISVLNKYGLLHKNSLLVHNSNISEDEIEILKNKEVFLIQAIDSNMNNAQNVANIHKFIKAGLNVTIGSDGMTSNILKLFKNSFLFTKYQNKTPDIGFEEINKMLLTSYKLKTAYGFPIGLIENETADFAITNYIPYTPFTQDNFLGHFIYGITESKINHLFSNGYLVLENEQITNLPVEKILRDALKNSKELFKRFTKKNSRG